MSNLLSPLFGESKVSLTLQHVQDRKSTLERIQSDLIQKFSLLIRDEKRFIKFRDAFFKQKLSAAGKLIYEDDLQGRIGAAIEEDFKEEYERVLKERIENLKESIDTQEIAEQAQTGLQKKLNTKKDEFVKKLTPLLKRKNFTPDDEQCLNATCHDYLAEIIQQLSHTLLEIKPEIIQARLQLDSANSALAKIDRHMTVSADKKDLNQLKIASQAPPLEPAYKINISDLSKRIKHSLASLKPGEKINIALSVPLNREDSLKRIAELGLQYRTPLLVALLLLFFIQLKMIKKDDETRVLEAIKKLAADGIAVNPNDIQLEVSRIDHNGKKEILAKELSPHSIQELERVIQQFNAQLKQKCSFGRPNNELPSLRSPESGYNSEADDEDVNTFPSPR